MKLNKLEKTLIIFLLVAAIIGAGVFFLIYPNIQDTEKTRLLIDEKNTQIEEAYRMAADDEKLNEEYAEAIEKAVQVQKSFYTEMSVTDATKEVQRIIEEAGHRDVGGIQITPLKPAVLSISVYTPPSDEMNYEIRPYSFLQRLQEAGEIVGEENESGALEITREEALRLVRGGTIEKDEKKELLDILRNMLADQRVEIGVIGATFTLNLTYRQYLNFLNYINELPQATSIGSVNFKDNVAANSNARDNYNFNINLFVVREMDIPDGQLTIDS